MHMYGKFIREGRTGFETMAEVHNTLSEDVSSGVFKGSLGDGKWQHRKIASEMFSAPRL